MEETPEQHRRRLRAYEWTYRQGKGRAKHLARRARWRASEEGKAKRAAYRQASKEKINAYHRVWITTPKGRAATEARRVNPEKSSDAWSRLLEQHGHRCVYCQRSDRPLMIDHMIPTSKGGSLSSNNIVPACAPCHSSKGDRVWFP